MFWKATSLGFAFWITLTSLGNADTLVSLNPSHENTLIQSSAGTLSNAQGNIYVGLTNQAAGTNIRRGLIEFNIAGSSIPADATITGGTLTMTDVTSGTNNGVQTLNLYDVSQAWGQGTSYCRRRRRGRHQWTMPPGSTRITTPHSRQPRGHTRAEISALTLSGSATDATNGQLVVWSSASNPQMIDRHSKLAR